MREYISKYLFFFYMVQRPSVLQYVSQRTLGHCSFKRKHIIEHHILFYGLSFISWNKKKNIAKLIFFSFSLDCKEGHMKKNSLCVCLFASRSKEHFLRYWFSWVFKRFIGFYTNPRSVEMSTHPVAWQVTSGIIGIFPWSKKHFFMKTWKYRVLHESKVHWGEYSSSGIKGTTLDT